jgi:hypothetical protein
VTQWSSIVRFFHLYFLPRFYKGIIEFGLRDGREEEFSGSKDQFVKNPETLSNMFLMIKIMNSFSLEIFISTELFLLLAQRVFSLSESGHTNTCVKIAQANI